MRVGVIVPVRAPAPYLAEALESVLAQEPAPDEVVVVQDGARAALEVPADVRLVQLADAGGPARARQEGLRALDADLIALADADDVWEPGNLAAQLAALGDASVCFGRAVVVDGSGRPTDEALPSVAPGLHRGPAFAGELYER